LRTDMLPTEFRFVRHLYFFDDLSYHLRRLAGTNGELVRRISDLLLEALKCLDHEAQDYTFVPWEHACSSLAYVLDRGECRYDITVSQGCNGEHAFKSLSLSKAGARLGAHRNVRIAHFLSDSADPFFSKFQLSSSSAVSLEQQLDDAAAQIAAVARNARVAVFDDCIQTGEGTLYVLRELRRRVPDCTFEAVGFIVSEGTARRMLRDGIEVQAGVLLRGEVYPHAWDWDVYFTKDLFLPNAVRFQDGTSRAYVDGGWFDKIFGRSPERARELFLEMKRACVAAGVYESLVAL
jgi:hypothetical protein